MIIGASSSGASLFFLVIIVCLVLWLIVVRPQKRRQTQQQRMQSDLVVGDEVLTVGGIYGTVTRIGDDDVSVQLAPQLEVRVARRAIAGVTHAEAEDPEEPAATVAAEPAEVDGGEGSTDESGG
jgi:preprotein translocase subunit YajC